jgi:hypothetical protein
LAMRPWQAVRAFGPELVDEIDGGEEASARPRSHAASRDCDRQMRLARCGSSGEDDIVLLADETPAGEIALQRLIVSVSLKAKCSRSLAGGSLATVSWYLI